EVSFMTTGKYGGIGSIVRKDGDFAVIVLVYKGFPADIAGLKPGDILTNVDGVSLKGLTSEQVSDRLKGDPGTVVKLAVDRNGATMDFNLKREKIVIPPVPYYGMLDPKTGYIRFTGFTENCSDDVRNALVALKADNAQQIILDIRTNPGGLLTEAVNIVNLFVDPGTEVVSTKGKVKQFDEEFKTTKPAFDDKIPLAIIINRGSASASEIVAGAIQDLDRGVIVGQRSYGKGLVQITRPLSYNAQLKVTTAKYYIPSGRCIQALDYSHRNPDGSVGYIPDSLISDFKTRDGRIVKNGGGISPDVKVEPESLSQIASELFLRNYIFDFATQYYWSHPEIKSVDQIRFTDKDYTDFRDFLHKRNFKYETLTDDSFNDLVQNAKKEKYYDLHKDLFDELGTAITPSLDKDLQNFRDEIAGLLMDEIVSRYFYEAGSIAYTLPTDKQVLEAQSVLNNRQEYYSILEGKSGSTLVEGQKNAPPAEKDLVKSINNQPLN
ncbi:MAG: S41 family peptidase, partial [Bacteroidales bacterium]